MSVNRLKASYVRGVTLTNFQMTSAHDLFESTGNAYTVQSVDTGLINL